MPAAAVTSMKRAAGPCVAEQAVAALDRRDEEVGSAVVVVVEEDDARGDARVTARQARTRA